MDEKPIKSSHGRPYTILNGDEVRGVMNAVAKATGHLPRTLVFGTMVLFTGDAVEFLVKSGIAIVREPSEMIETDTGEDTIGMTNRIACPHCKEWIDPPPPPMVIS